MSPRKSLNSTWITARTDTHDIRWSSSVSIINTDVGEYGMSERECTSCAKLQEIMAIGINAPIWICYDCGRPIEEKASDHAE